MTTRSTAARRFLLRALATLAALALATPAGAHGEDHDPCEADLDHDGVVGASDFFDVYRPCVGADLATRPECAAADLDADGVVAPADFFGFLRPAMGTVGCPVAGVCGDGVVGGNEQCDGSDDAACPGRCTAACTCSTECTTTVFDTTWDAIQEVVFEGYGCTNVACHGELQQGGLDLRAGASYGELVNVPAVADPTQDRVEPGEPAASFLYEKLAAKTLGTPTTNSPMPLGPTALTPEHLEAVRLWIRGGAPDDAVVEGTAELLGTCLPDPDPLKIDPPAPPPPGTGVQLRQTAWPLPAESEDEICMATYYDFSNLIPAEQQFDCPGFASANNPTGKCFRYHRQVLVQDPQSHHSIIHIYTGSYDVNYDGGNNRKFGPFTIKRNDLADPLNGTACDPKAIDPALGYNPDCSGAVRSGVACIGYGPPDYGNNGTAPAFSGSQEPYFEREFADGVYSVLPVAGVVVWNSHAFNLTDTDTTMAQYLNLDLAGPADSVWPAQGIFDARYIFSMNVPPFETREICATYTLPEGARLFDLSSHTHKRGAVFRIWGPPNTPCTPNDATCVPGPPERLISTSTDYSDPVQTNFDPPLPPAPAPVEDRTYLYCALYDNGSTPTSPPVKQQSTSPPPPLIFAPGGPCSNAEVACMDGPRKGEPCGLVGGDAFCGTGPGSCDACPVKGGVTTEDEMFILLGSYYVP